MIQIIDELLEEKEDVWTDDDYLDTGLLIITIYSEGYGTIDLPSSILYEGIHAEIYRLLKL